MKRQSKIMYSIVLMLICLGFSGCNDSQYLFKDLERNNGRDVKALNYSESNCLQLETLLSSDEYKNDDAINYKVKLSNIGNGLLKVSGLNKIENATSLKLKTPEGYTLFIGGARVPMLPNSINLEGGSCITEEYDLTNTIWADNKTVFSYKIGALGEYSIELSYYPYSWERNWDDVIYSEIWFEIVP